MAAAAGSSSSTAAPTAFKLSWEPSSLAAARPTTAADLDALSARFRVPIPPVLARLLTAHGGEQPAEGCSTLWAQNVQSGAWRRERLGPLYPAAAAEPDDEAMEARAGMGFDLASVNEMFLEEPEDDDDEETAAQSKKSKAKAKKPKAPSTKPLLPFFAFAECLNSGFVLALDTASGAVMLLDLSGRRGPWIAGSSAEDFCARLEKGPELKREGEEEEDDAEEEVMDDSDGAEDDGEGEGAAAAGEGDDQGFCCDVCLIELPSSLVRFHCDVCECYDLCDKCMKDAEKASKKAATAAAASSSSAAKKGGRSAAVTKGHPASHTFTRIEPMEDEQEGDDDEEQ